jgi:hypothetical protein
MLKWALFYFTHCAALAQHSAAVAQPWMLRLLCLLFPNMGAAGPGAMGLNAVTSCGSCVAGVALLKATHSAQCTCARNTTTSNGLMALLGCTPS